MIKILGFEHVSWAAEGLDQPKKILGLFGIKPTGHEDIHDQDVQSTYFSGDGGTRFEVIQPLGDASHLAKFLKTRGPGLHHVCFQVEDLDQACEEVVRAGGELVGHQFSDSRGRHAFVHPRSTGGVLIGMIELHQGLRPDDPAVGQSSEANGPEGAQTAGDAR